MPATTSSSEERDLSASNEHVFQEKRHDSKKLFVAKRVFTHQNSVLTDLMEVNHLRSLYNISVTVCLLLFLNTVICCFVDPDKFWHDVRVLRWATGKFSFFVIIWMLLHAFAFAVYEGFKVWITVRSRIDTKFADRIFMLLFIASIVFMYTVTPYLMLTLSFPLITGFATATEQVRISMKIYSFVRENAPHVRRYKPQKGGRRQHILYPTRKHYFYYLFVPALIYKDSYPRTEKIQWKNVCQNLFQFAGVIFIAYCTFIQFSTHQFKNVGLRQFTTKEVVLVSLGSMAVGFIALILLFYGIFHCWLNVFAELLRFGDREFYGDWWNITSFSKFYRKWSSVVHEWLHSYAYTELQRFGCNRDVSLILVFLISALVHEYIISLATGFFFPVFFLIYSTFGVYSIYLTRGKTSQLWNIFMWSSFFSGFGAFISSYYAEWYARMNCPKEERTLDFFIPRSWDPACHILNFF